MACDGYWDGVSGGPWMINFNGTTGDIIGNVGGLNGGGPADSHQAHYDRYGWPDDLITVWADGHVTLYQDTGSKGLGPAVTLVG